MLYLDAKPSHVWGNVDGLACSLHFPVVCSRQRGGQSLLTGTTPSCEAAVGSAVFLGDVKPPGLDIIHGIYHLVTCKTESTWRSPPLQTACLSDIRAIMVIMRVPMVESLCQATMGRMPGKIYPILESPGWSDWEPVPISGRGGRRARQTGGEILPSHVYYNEKKVMVWITLEFSCF
jgi:hypothetical protein